MPTKLCPKIILEGTRLTNKTEIAFALNEHPRIVGQPNWCWRLRPGALTDEVTARIRELTAIYGRMP